MKFKYKMNEVIDKIIEYEKNFSENNYFGKGEKNFEIKEGYIPIMLSSPHAVNSIRCGKIKNADILTGSIALLLRDITGCHIIFSTKTDNYDPNYDINEYKDVLTKYINDKNIKVLIDIHGLSKTNPCAIEIGTCPMYNCDGNIVGDELRSLKNKKYIIDIIKEVFSELFINNNEKNIICVNNIFSGGKTNTISKYVCDNTNSVSFQIEINRDYRDLEKKENIDIIVEFLRKIILRIYEHDAMV